MSKKVSTSEAFVLDRSIFLSNPDWVIEAKKIGHRMYIFYTKNTLLYRLILMFEQEGIYRLVTSDGALDGISL